MKGQTEAEARGLRHAPGVRDPEIARSFHVLPQTVDEWALSLPEEDRKRLTAILVYTPFARDFLQRAWSMGFQQAAAALKDSK